MNLERALTIEGWMSEPELEWLAEQASKYHLVCEIGCWMGRTTRALADNSTGGVVAVDTWNGSIENQEFLKHKPVNWLYEEFMKNLADQIKADKVTVTRMDSLVAANMFWTYGVKFGFVFIDGSHEYGDVIDDINAWKPLVMKGGILSGHDYDWGYPGVVRAVRELISPTPLQAAGGSSIWYQMQ